MYADTGRAGLLDLTFRALFGLAKAAKLQRPSSIVVTSVTGAGIAAVVYEKMAFNSKAARVAVSLAVGATGGLLASAGLNAARDGYKNRFSGL